MEGLRDTKYYTLGCRELYVTTDHKPLIGLFQKYLTDIQNFRLLSIAEKTLWFKFRVIHVEEKLNNG